MATTRIESYTLANKADLYVLDCSNCGVVFAIPNEMQRRRYKDGRSFMCPNGHGQSWHETEEDRQRRRAEQAERAAARERARRDQAESEAREERRRTEAARSETNRTRKRLAGGACPCCNRTFTNLARHMTGQHPEYVGFDDVPDDFTWWSRGPAVVHAVTQAGEGLSAPQVLGRLVLAGRRSDTLGNVKAALYNSVRAGRLVKAGRGRFMAAPDTEGRGRATDG